RRCQPRSRAVSSVAPRALCPRLRRDSPSSWVRVVWLRDATVYDRRAVHWTGRKFQRVNCSWTLASPRPSGCTPCASAIYLGGRGIHAELSANRGVVALPLGCARPSASAQAPRLASRRAGSWTSSAIIERISTGTRRAWSETNGGDIMLYTLVVVLLVLWALGLATSYTLGGVLHLLLVAAVVLLAVQLVTGRRTV